MGISQAARGRTSAGSRAPKRGLTPNTRACSPSAGGGGKAKRTSASRHGPADTWRARSHSTASVYSCAGGGMACPPALRKTTATAPGADLTSSRPRGSTSGKYAATRDSPSPSVALDAAR